MEPSTKYRIGMWLCLIVALATLLMIPVALGTPLHNCPGANFIDLIVMPVVLSAAYIGGAINFRRLARKHAEASAGIAAGSNILAHWAYFDAEWSVFTEVEYQIDKKRTYKACWFVTAYSVLLAVVLTLVFYNQKPVSLKYLWIFGGLGIIILNWLVLLITLHRKHRRNIQIKGEAIISSEALMFNGTLYAWNTVNKELIDVKYTEGPPPMIEFKYGKMLRRGRSQNTVRVPVPYGKEENAKDIARFFQDALGTSGMMLDRKRQL
jgi:hypothetical protein